MNCLRCELTRAKLKASFLVLAGWSLDRIAEKLSNDYGERYYVVRTYVAGLPDSVGIKRASKLPPFIPHVIYERGLNDDR